MRLFQVQTSNTGRTLSVNVKHFIYNSLLIGLLILKNFRLVNMRIQYFAEVHTAFIEIVK